MSSLACASEQTLEVASIHDRLSRDRHGKVQRDRIIVGDALMRLCGAEVGRPSIN